MPPAKLTVQGFLTNVGDSTSPEDSTNRIKNDLERVLRAYGPVTCVHVGSDETSLPDPSPAKKRRMNESGGEQNKFAHMLFENAEDAAKACQAAVNREITLGDNPLILTLVSESSTTIENLDDYSLLKIFSMLGAKDKVAVEEVCRRWKKLMKYCWPKMTILRLGSIYPARFRTYLKRCGKYLKSLETVVRTRTTLDLILKYCKKLEALKLRVELEDCESDAFCRMFKGLKNLTTLDLSHQEKIFDMSFMEYLPKKMKKISLSCTFGRKESVDFDLAKFPNLESLYLSGYDINAGWLVGAESLRNLIHLEFDDCKIYRRITRKFQNLTTLKTLKMPISGITDDILINILTHNPGLETLDISQSPALTDGSVQLVSTLLNLKKLNVSKLPVTFRFLGIMPSLERLECEECTKLTNERVVSLIQSAPKLQHLNLCDSSITSDLFSLANAALKQRDNNIELKIFTTESTDEWKRMENPSPLLKILRTVGMKSERVFMERLGIFEYEDDLNDERSDGSSSDEDSDDY